MQNKEFHQQIVSLVKVADIGIDNITLKEEDLDLDFIKEIPIPDEIREELLKKGNFKSVSINTSHKLFDENNSQVGEEIFEIDKDESFGTQKFFKISAPIIDTLREGKIIVIDELDSSLHPFLTRHLIELFHNKDYNKKNAQLIFTTHDTNLLNPQLFRRDQIWFTEKDKYGSTDIYSLSEIKNVRKDDDFEAKYIQGKYGAVPYIGKFEF
jgi:AAA15 family ATPase/GTPase